MNILYGVLGLVGGILCACGDLLLDLKGKDNRKLGKYRMIDSAWERMPVWRFRASAILAMVGVPLYFLGLHAMANQLAAQNPALGRAFWLVSLFGSIGGFFIHALLCVMPPIYQILMRDANFELAEKVINRAFDVVKIPFYLTFLMLVGVTSLLIAYAVCAGFLALSPLWLLATPLCLMLVGVGLRFWKPDWFFDLPGIVMPSVGLGMIGLMAAVSAGF